MKVIFEPVAQNTIIRPIAQAVCLAHGGQLVDYTDTSDHKRKSIDVRDLYFLRLQTTINKRKVDIDAAQIALKAEHEPILVQVNINDVQVLISQTTTVEQAMIQFYKKLKQQQKKEENLYLKAQQQFGR